MSNLSRVYAQAIRYLGVRDHSRAQLRTKLLRSCDSGQVEEVLNRLEDEKLLDDGRYALNRALYSRRRKHWGDLRIKAYLRRQGIDESLVRSALSALEAESSQEEALLAVIEAWTRRSGKPRSTGQLRRLRDHCLRLGHPAALIRRHLLTRVGSGPTQI